jgi:curved DNA-binding protein
MEFKDYYQILGVQPNADDKEIKSAYRKLARKYHPDMNPDKSAEDKFKEVAEAYEALKNAERRAEYDELRQYGGSGKGFEPPPGWQAGGGFSGGQNAGYDADFSDFFNTIFGAGRRGSYQSQQGEAFAFKGQDAEIELPVFLEETLSEESKLVEYLIPVYEHGQKKEIKKTLKVKIPAGISDGERIRLKGQGAPSPGGGENGDLYLHIRLVPHPLFDVQGHNLIITVPLAPWEAALGTKVEVPTLTGKINLNIAPNSQSGQKLRIKGKGLPRKAGIGDLYAVLKVVMPATSNDEVNKLWSKLSEKAAFNPRAEWSN